MRIIFATMLLLATSGAASALNFFGRSREIEWRTR